MLKHVYDFNKARNQFKWDIILEKKMYAEEVKEFFDANTLAERIDALVDCQYVRIGTELKMAANCLSTLPYANNEQKMYEIIRIEIYNQFTPITSWGENAISCNDNNNIVETIMSAAQKIVCQANELKGLAKSAEGKVLKDAAYEEKVNATKQIALMLEDELKPKRY